MRHFFALLENRWQQGAKLCVGLDSDYSKLPESIKTGDIKRDILHFNKAIIEATAEYACTFKIQTAYYEEHGTAGLEVLAESITYIQETTKIPVIADAKRGDIGDTNLGYIRAIFDSWQADAVTVHPYLGKESLQPFLDREDKGIFVLCRTSNPGSAELQDVTVEESGLPLYLHIARQVHTEWNKKGNCGLVVGATYPEDAKKIRKEVGDMPFLIPGIGAQGGDLQKTVEACKTKQGEGMIINASRSIIFASSGTDFAVAAEKAAKSLNDAINAARR